MKKIMIIMCMLMFLCGCDSKQQETVSQVQESSSQVQETSSIQSESKPQQTTAARPQIEPPTIAPGATNVIELVWGYEVGYKEEPVPEDTKGSLTVINKILGKNDIHAKVYKLDIDNDKADEYVFTYPVDEADVMNQLLVYDLGLNKEWEAYDSSKKQTAWSAQMDEMYKQMVADSFSRGFDGFERECMENRMVLEQAKCYPIVCDGKNMLHITTRLKEDGAKYSFIYIDVNMIVKYENGNYVLDKYWYAYYNPEHMQEFLPWGPGK